MPSATIFVDANIPMYAVGAGHPLKAPCLRVMSLLAEGMLPAITNAEVLQEILHRYLALGRRDFGTELVRRFGSMLPIIPVTGDDVVLAAELAPQHPGLAARDLVHVAVMLHNHLDTIVSADAHFDGIPGIRRLAPESL